MQVKTTEGIVEGEQLTNEFCGSYYSFKGIPYAAPPVGDLRFKAPQPPQPWEGVRSAKAHSDICHQYNFITHLVEKGSEDCLYLNVYTPDVKPVKPLPVMIWIHGGAFCCGSGNDDLYGPEYLIGHGVILVTLNYRLEILGFLCMDTEDIPGNAGIKDQVAAMKWVNKNIASFGGDPNNVTLFGQSSGGVCVTYHCVSPMTKGLFKRAISQSGSANNWMGQAYRPRDRALAFAKTLGCTSKDDKEIYEFFKKVPIESLTFIQTAITFAEHSRDKSETTYTVVSEKVFPDVEPYFTGNVIDALKNDIHEGVELIIGYNEDEGVINLGVLYDIRKTIEIATNFKEYFVPKQLSLYCSIDEQLSIGEELRNFYAKNKTISMSNLDPLVKFYACDLYKYGIYQLAKYFSVKNKVYFYKFTCKSERNFFSKIMGATEHFRDRDLVGHSDEIPYLFPVKSIQQNISKTSPTYKMINNFTKLWTNFAKTGNPTPDTSLGVNWRQFRATAPSYLEIGNTLVRSTGPDKAEIEVWENIYKKYLPSQLYQKPEVA